MGHVWDTCTDCSLPKWSRYDVVWTSTLNADFRLLVGYDSVDNVLKVVACGTVSFVRVLQVRENSSVIDCLRFDLVVEIKRLRLRPLLELLRIRNNFDNPCRWKYCVESEDHVPFRISVPKMMQIGSSILAVQGQGTTFTYFAVRVTCFAAPSPCRIVPTILVFADANDLLC